MNVKEALKRLKQETIPATYNPDFDKNECIDIIEKELNQKDYLEFMFKMVLTSAKTHFVRHDEIFTISLTFDDNSVVANYLKELLEND